MVKLKTENLSLNHFFYFSQKLTYLWTESLPSDTFHLNLNDWRSSWSGRRHATCLSRADMVRVSVWELFSSPGMNRINRDRVYIVSAETEFTRGLLPGIHNRGRGLHTDHHDTLWHVNRCQPNACGVHHHDYHENWSCDLKYSSLSQSEQNRICILQD